MLNQTSGNRLIQLLAIAFLSSLLITSVASAEILGKGLFKGVEYCHDPAKPEKALKLKVKDPFEVDISRSGTDISATVTFADASMMALNGNILAKNAKSGVFQLFGMAGFTELAMNGKYKLTGAGGDLKIVSGAFQGQDLEPSTLCLFAGKFKAKEGPVPAP
jgi:hypothetical protein